MKHRYTFEYFFYTAAFLLALALRLVNLNTLPLSDFEARWALPASNLALGKVVEVGSQPFYELWTSLLFFLFSQSEFIARLIPAIMGSVLIILPFLLRHKLGKTAAIVTAFGLAIDPGLVAVSHYAGSPMVALSLTMLALGFWYTGSRRAAVCLAVLAALSGSAFFFGFVILLIGLGLGRLLRLWDKQDLTGFFQSNQDKPNPSDDKTGLILVAALTLLVGGTLFFRYPQGLAGFARSFSEFMQSWIIPSGVPSLNMVWMLLFFQPLALLLGVAGFIRSWINEDRFDRMLGIWMVCAWVLCILDQGRQNWDLIWVLMPLWMLAGREIVRYWDVEKEEILPTQGHILLLFILFSLGWLNLAGLIIPQSSPEIVRMRWILILGVVVLGILATILISFGWSIRIAKRGFTNGIVFCLLLFVISTTVSVVNVNSIGEGAPYSLYPPQGQWSSGAITTQSSLLMDAISDLAEWNTGNPKITDVAIVTREPICQTCLPSAALQWALRDISQVRVIESLPTGETPAIVITPYEEQELKLAEAYRGQSFTWQAQSAWRDGYPVGWLRWILSRQVTAETGKIILWVRSDQFPGGKPVVEKRDLIENQIESLLDEQMPGGGNE